MEFLTQINYLALILWMAVLYLLGKFIKKWWMRYVTKYNERVIAQREEAIRVEKETERLNIKTTFTFMVLNIIWLLFFFGAFIACVVQWLFFGDTGIFNSFYFMRGIKIF